MRRPVNLKPSRTWRCDLMDFVEGKEDLDQHEVSLHPVTYLRSNLLDVGESTEGLDQHDETWHPHISREE
jgi:hypothetical protein